MRLWRTAHLSDSTLNWYGDPRNEVVVLFEDIPALQVSPIAGERRRDEQAY